MMGMKTEPLSDSVVTAVTSGTPAKGGANRFLLFVILLSIVLFYGRAVMIPLVSGAFLAMLMMPVSHWLETRIRRPFAIIICILLLLIVLLGILAIVVAEISNLLSDLPGIQHKANEALKVLESDIQTRFGTTPERQIEMMKIQVATLGQSAGSYFSRLMSGVTSVLAGLVITLVYTFLLLYHRERYELFFIKLFGRQQPEKTKAIIENLTRVGQRYLKGRTISVLLLWVFYAGGFLLIGLNHAILLGAIAALMSILPYVGGIVGGIFPFLMALTGDDSSGTAVGVIVVTVLAHALSTYIIEPLVVGGQLRLSALSMIVFIIAGSALWGIAGMILFIPILAMVKILCDTADHLKPYGYLISDPDEGKVSVMGQWFSRRWSKVNAHDKK
jgi:predicted PurR-regulated permease PerM